MLVDSAGAEVSTVDRCLLSVGFRSPGSHKTSECQNSLVFTAVLLVKRGAWPSQRSKVITTVDQFYL